MTAKEPTTRVISDSGDDVGPGQRLREAREAAQLSLGEVASRMRLEPHVLELLENDQYERLHGPTFVRGYLSGYARLLDLPARPILEAYERHDHRPPALVSELGRKPEVHVSDFPVRMVTYVIAGLLIVLVVLWWQSRQLHTGTPEHAGVPSSQSGMASTGDAASSGTPAASFGGAAPMPATKLPTGAESSQPPTGTAPGAAEDLQAAVPAKQPQTPATGGDGNGEPTQRVSAEGLLTEKADSAVPGAPPEGSPEPAAMAEATADATNAPGAGQPAETAAQPGPQSAALPAVTGAEPAASAVAGEGVAGNAADTLQAPRPEPLPGSDRLAIQLKRESWVEIYDRGGGRLYYSLASEGSEVVVQGAGPMRVLLGDVEGAAVAYNGEPFDLSRYKGRSVVRFTVGEHSEAPAPRASPPAPTTEPQTQGTRQPLPASEQRDSVAAAGETLTRAPSAIMKRTPETAVQSRLPAEPVEAPQSAEVGALPDS